MSRHSERQLLLLACSIVLIFTASAMNFEAPDPARILIGAVAIVFLGLIALGRVLPWTVLVFIVCAGTLLRVHAPAVTASDVLDATDEALSVTAYGKNPYDHFYMLTRPAGEPFVYPPGELALYSIQYDIFGNLGQHDRYWGILALAGIASLSPLCGVGIVSVLAAFYAVTENIIFKSLDGSNDTGLAFLMVVAIALLAYATAAADRKKAGLAAILHALGAIFLGWAVAFKALAWFSFPFLARFAWRRNRAYTPIAAGVAVLFCLPFFIKNPKAFVASMWAAFTYHTNVWGFNVWAATKASHVDTERFATQFLVIALIVLGGIALGMWVRRPRTLGIAVLQGAVVLGAAMLLARWTTSSYFAYLAALLGVAFATYNVGEES